MRMIKRKTGTYHFNPADITTLKEKSLENQVSFTLVSSQTKLVGKKALPHNFKFTCTKGYENEIKKFIRGETTDNVLIFDENLIPNFISQD